MDDIENEIKEGIKQYIKTNMDQTALKQMTTDLFELYTAFVEAGFSREESFTLTLQILNR